ncbi:hypothetical protein FRC03_005105 [Tulasnella sp. 419]|nr:hypothetical protein FRC03_005105 [Tulasnella sp. 419]
MLHLRDTLSFLLPTLLLIAFALAAPYQTPTVSLGETTFVGKFVGGTEKFLGIRYAEAPRYKLPIPVTSYGADWIDVSRHGSACPQQPFRIETSSKWVTGILKKFIDGLFEKHLPESEDCLNLDIVRPIGTSTGSKLPVVVWIYGGAFLTGYTGLSVYDGKRLVELSQMLGQPMIFVAINYRLGGWGFLDSKDVRDAGVGNLGLHDQREALRWVQRNIAAFGGDPARVTAWGESAGAISIGFHMLANGGNTEGLFHAAIMQSGAYLPIAPGEGAQSKYDALVNLVGCQNEQNKLECLRKVPYETLKTVLRDRGDAFNCSGPIPTWIPRVDGTLLNQLMKALTLLCGLLTSPIMPASKTTFVKTGSIGLLRRNLTN